MRKHYIDNLRSIAILVLIPYHAAMAWNAWGEPNYMMFGSSRVLSSFIVFFSPFLMPLLFLLAGMSTRFALAKRSSGQYVVERVKRLIVPLLFGTVVLMPVLTYLADVRNCGYSGSFVSHYGVFFGKFTDLTGADGGFSFGQFWFLLYLFVISLICLGVICLQKKFLPRFSGNMPLWGVLLLGLPLPFLGGLLEIGGKSLVEYVYVFLLGYYVFSCDEVILLLRKYRYVLLSVGVVSSFANIYMFLWSTSFEAVNLYVNYLACWFMVLGLLGVGSSSLDFSSPLSFGFARTSFAFFSLHYIFVVGLQFVFADMPLVPLFLLPVLIAYPLTILGCYLCCRVRFLSFLLGVKPQK